MKMSPNDLLLKKMLPGALFVNENWVMFVVSVRRIEGSTYIRCMMFSPGVGWYLSKEREYTCWTWPDISCCDQMILSTEDGG
jgi:hypothetical protein